MHEFLLAASFVGGMNTVAKENALFHRECLYFAFRQATILVIYIYTCKVHGRKRNIAVAVIVVMATK